MPELPEVENIMLGLREVLPGRRVARVWVGTPLIIRGPYRRRWRSFVAELTGRRIESVTRRAKRLILAAEGRLALVFQLGMTGKFLLPDPGRGSRGGHAHAYATDPVFPGRDGNFSSWIRVGSGACGACAIWTRRLRTRRWKRPA